MNRQKKIRNIKYRDIVNLDSTLAKFILPRLEFFKKNTTLTPMDLTEEEWKDVLDKMVNAFKLVLDTHEPDFIKIKCEIKSLKDLFSQMEEDGTIPFDGDAYIEWHKLKQAKIDEGLQMFAKYFQNLWI